ncbi:SprT family zinc-dependent metalloprotease [Candidatus Vondammii sp. HM_W22]|uniref:SprT family zinc-dependent metalloprotease n=1 Tax=Candidatus Vondammii sp. HM_W22 TaxID=2687299 RepID=UPI001F12F79F|nr:SprT-like domain-containing protein [Candidatus Vondammii sp. HM_W22]
MNHADLNKRIENRSLGLLRQAERHYNRTMPEIEIRFDLRGRGAGMVCFPVIGKPSIRYNKLLLKENFEIFLAETVPHEIAHLVARTLFGKKIRPHGAEWKSVMDYFGIEAKRCHDFDVSRSSRRSLERFNYLCSCREHQLTSIRHNRAQAGTVYSCRRCGEVLKCI